MMAPRYECCRRTLWLFLAVIVTIGSTAPSLPAQQSLPPYPDVKKLYGEPFDEDYFDGTVACGWDALCFWMRDEVYRGNLGRLDNMHKTKFERLLLGEPDDVREVNREITEFCRRKQMDIEAAWKDPSRRHPAAEVCNYQTELIPLAIIALRVGDRLAPETHAAIKDVLLAFRPATPDVAPAMYMHAPGYNGGNAHDYLGMLAMSAEVTDDPEIRDATYWALRRELENLSLSGDMQEFNLLESHWCSTMGYEPVKRFLTDPEMARMARLISERIWLNRFLTWSAAVERITGPGSRMAPGAWLGCSGDRLQFATGLEKPIWLNVNFPWGPWDRRQMGGRWPLNNVEAMVPQLPSYLQDVAWRKQLPHELQCSVQLVPWMERFPRLDGISYARPEPTLAKYVDYQTDQYTIGSITHAWDASTCMVYMSAWWNDSQHEEGALLGSPRRFCTLYPHYVFNGTSFLDRTEMYFENHPDEPARDEWSRQPGPFMREFAEYGRAGSLQHENTVIFTYSGRKGDHTGNDLVADKARRVSAAMFLFRWQPGTDGLYVNREPVWLLSCAPSQTYVAYQPHPHRQLRLELDSSIARVECERFPFGKLVLRKTSDTHVTLEIDASYRPFWSGARWRAQVWQELGTLPSNLLIQTDAEQVTATINGQEMPVTAAVREGRKVWRLDPYARIPRTRDRALDK